MWATIFGRHGSGAPLCSARTCSALRAVRFADIHSYLELRQAAPYQLYHRQRAARFVTLMLVQTSTDLDQIPEYPRDRQ